MSHTWASPGFHLYPFRSSWQPSIALCRPPRPRAAPRVPKRYSTPPGASGFIYKAAGTAPQDASLRPSSHPSFLLSPFAIILVRCAIQPKHTTHTRPTSYTALAPRPHLPRLSLAMRSLRAVLALLPALVVAQNGYGRFPCGTFAPEQSLCDAAEGQDGTDGAGVLTGLVCQQQPETLAYFCGIAGAVCQTSSNCDYGMCVNGACSAGLGGDCAGDDFK